VIHKALDHALIHNLVQKNVANVANPPRPARFGEHEIKTWEAAQLRVFLESIEEHRYYPAYLLASTTGMRRGEVLGLRWKDLDLERGELSVTQTLTSSGYKLRFSPPKTRRSRRCIPLDQRTVASLQAHKVKQAAEKLAKGAEYVGTGLVFTREDGSAYHPDLFSHLFNDLVKKTRLPRIRFHDLRHTYATLALQEDVNVKVVSERLGRSSAAFTMDVYQHVLPSMQQEAADAVAAAVFGS
jgi:integrase